MVFPKNRITFLGVPVVRILAFGGLCWCPSIVGNYLIAFFVFKCLVCRSLLLQSQTCLAGVLTEHPIRYMYVSRDFYRVAVGLVKLWLLREDSIPPNLNPKSG